MKNKYLGGTEMKCRWIVVLVAVLGIGATVRAGDIGAYSLQTGIWTFKEYEFRDTAAYNLLAKYVSREYYYVFSDSKKRREKEWKKMDRLSVLNAPPINYYLAFIKLENMYISVINFADDWHFNTRVNSPEKIIGAVKMGNSKFFIRSYNDDPENIRQFMQQNFINTGRMCLYYVPNGGEDVSFASFCGPSSWQFVVGTDWKWHLLFCPKDSLREGITNNG